MSETVIFRTKKLYEADMVLASLEEADIPCFIRQQIGSLEHAMPLGAADWFGTSWLVYVPDEMVEKANEIVLNFPFAEETGQQEMETPESAEQHRRIIWIFIAIIALILCSVLLL